MIMLRRFFKIRLTCALNQSTVLGQDHTGKAERKSQVAVAITNYMDEQLAYLDCKWLATSHNLYACKATQA